jgi:hypothetical protein
MTHVLRDVIARACPVLSRKHTRTELPTAESLHQT